VIVRLALRAAVIPDVVQFVISWLYLSSAAVNGCLYIALHSSVRSELRRHLPHCRRRHAVAAAPPVNADARYRVGVVDTGTAITHRAPARPSLAMTSPDACQHVPQQLPVVALWRSHVVSDYIRRQFVQQFYQDRKARLRPAREKDLSAPKHYKFISPFGTMRNFVS